MKKVRAILTLFGLATTSAFLCGDKINETLAAVHNLGPLEKSIFKVYLAINGPEDSFGIYPTITKETLRNVLKATHVEHNIDALNNASYLLEQVGTELFPTIVSRETVFANQSFVKLKNGLITELQDY